MGFKTVLVGGSGGLGRQLMSATPLNGKYDCHALSSQDVDVSDPKSVEDMVSSLEPQILINLASVNIDSLLSKTSPEDVRKQVDVNVIGNTNLIRSFTKLNIPKQFGRYIYISSVLAKRKTKGAGIYQASKAFNDALIETAALENAKYKITFNSIQLGYFGVGMCDRLPEHIQESALNRIPLRRFGNIKELYRLIDYFICTEYATGNIVPLTGGLDI